VCVCAGRLPSEKPGTGLPGDLDGGRVCVCV